MPDLSTKTNDQLFDRLGELEAEINAHTARADEVRDSDSASAAFVTLHEQLSEVALIHIEMARRTATGWRPL